MKELRTAADVEAFHERLTRDLQRLYQASPEVASAMAKAAVDELVRMQEDEELLAIGDKIAEEDAEGLRLLAD